MNQNPDHIIELDTNVINAKLDNGFTYYIRKNTTPKQKVELRLAVNVGSVCEGESQRGIAHFIEHMAFKGTENFTDTKVIKHLSSLGVAFGVDLNASTGFDRTLYTIAIASKYVEVGLQVMSDWAFSILLDKDAIDSERSVILEELRTGQGADQRMRDRWFPKLMSGTKYENRMPIGLKKVIKTAPREEFLEFYKRWYRPDNMAVIVVGDIEPKEIEEKIKELFGRGHTEEQLDKKDDLSDLPNSDIDYRVILETDPEAQYNIAQIILKNPFRDIKTENQYKDFVLRNIYIAMLNARLTELSQGANPEFLYANSSYYHLVKTTDIFVIYAILPPERIIKAISRMIEGAVRLDKYGMSEKEFFRAKDAYLNDLHRRLVEKDKTNSSVLADEYVTHFTEGDAAPGIEYEYRLSKEFLETVDVKQVNDFVKNLFTEDGTILMTGFSQELPDKDDITQMYQQIMETGVKPWDEEDVPQELVSDLPQPAELLTRKEIPSIGVTELVFKGGVRVILKPSSNKNDEVIFSAFRRGGRSQYSSDLHTPSLLSSHTVEESGLGGFSKSTIKKYLSGKTVALGMNINNYQDNLSGYSSARDMKTMFELIYLGFTAAGFSKSAFNAQKEKSVAIIKASMEDPGEYFSDYLKRILSSSHPRGEHFPSINDMKNADSDLAREAFDRSFSYPEQFTYLFVGNFTVEQMIPLIAQYIASLGTDAPQSDFVDLGIRPPDGKYEQIIRKGVDDKAVISMVFDTKIEYNIKLAYAFKGLGEVLKIRLIDRLRSEMGAVYGVRVETDFIRVPYSHTRLHINVSCSPDNYKVLTDATLEELESIRTNGPSQTIVQDVKTTLLRQIEDSYQRNGFWMMQLQRFTFLKDDIERTGRLIEELENISVDSIRQAAVELINTHEYISLMMLGKNEVED